MRCTAVYNPYNIPKRTKRISTARAANSPLTAFKRRKGLCTMPSCRGMQWATWAKKKNNKTIKQNVKCKKKKQHKNWWKTRQTSFSATCGTQQCAPATRSRNVRINLKSCKITSHSCVSSIRRNDGKFFFVILFI